MKVFITGAGGFVGRWLVADLDRAGHSVVRAPGRSADAERLDVRDQPALSAALATTQPDAVVHLAAISAAGDAAADPQAAFEVTVGGTLNLMEAITALGRAGHEAAAGPRAVLVVGSSEVYGSPDPADLPLSEKARLRPLTAYALSKAAQESVALAYAARHDLPLVVARSFNHVGPGQRPDFVVPALARRIRELRDGRATDIPVGNLDVRRDFSDVRDVVRAYRLMLESLADGRIERGGMVLNVSSGESVSIRRIVELLCDAAGVPATTRVEPTLVRTGEAVEIRGEAGALRAATGWTPEADLGRTLVDVWNETAAGEGTCRA